ncbi:MAG: FtsW/RodA/SpoVE family cell cycle protein [Anaerolineales bacterium]
MRHQLARFLAPVKIEGRLFVLAFIFVFLYALALSLSPAARERTWDVNYRLIHWTGFAAWAGIFYFVHRQSRRLLPDADPYLLPLAALLSGWGLMTIFRLTTAFGMRQVLWLTALGILFLFGLRLTPELRFLRRYKYLALTSGLLLTALTLIFGANPLGSGPRLWLGCCGIYLQPSEPLKLLLIIYLAAYFADHLPLNTRLLPLLRPTALVTGLALILLVAQRDLGTASLFIVLYTVMLFIASGRKRVLVVSLLGLALTGVAGYFLFDVIRLRVDAWLNPWSDPAGRSYQIVQSLLAVANGGLGGRGPGLGNPGLVPVTHSDFIFAAIAEETGLVGTVGLLAAIGLLFARGLRIALRAPDQFRRLLAVGLSAYLGIQSLLIIGGNLRLLPLTGVTLPFISYGGSSLLTSFAALLLLLLISSQPEDEPAPLRQSQPYLILAALFGLALTAAALTNTWWAIGRGPDLLTRTDNARRAIADRYVQRGALLDRAGRQINATLGRPGQYERVYLYPALAPIIGYTHPVYGQAGLEASLDPYLRGLQGNPAKLIWWSHLLYGQPPPGLDVRLSLDLRLQQQADQILGNHAGAVVLLNASSGEILVMASHPTYDPARLDEQAASLAQDPRSPLLNRAAQGRYPCTSMLTGLFAPSVGLSLRTTSPPDTSAVELLDALGLYQAPALSLPVAAASSPDELPLISPLQAALAAAAYSNGGLRPAPRLAMAVNTPAQGWIILPPLSEPVQALPPEAIRQITDERIVAGEPYWEWLGHDSRNGSRLTWYVGGTLPDWQATPLTVVILLEEENPSLATYLGRRLLEEALRP